MDTETLMIRHSVSTMKARLQEEVRLVELARGTRVRYMDMGVFSAVAGN